MELPRLLDAFGSEVCVGDNIITVKEANKSHWYIKDFILRRFTIASIEWCVKPLNKYNPETAYYHYYKWRSEPITLKDGTTRTVGGQSKKYKRLKYIMKYGVVCPFIYKESNANTSTMS
jgi:hypothetical protein